MADLDSFMAAACGGDDPAVPRKSGGLTHEKDAVVTVMTAAGELVPVSDKEWPELKLPKPVEEAAILKGWMGPSKIQAAALPVLLDGQSIIAQAQNGSGKTGAFTLAMLSLIDVTKPYTQAVCISPTRELALQNYEVCCQLSAKWDEVDVAKCVPQDIKGKGKGKDGKGKDGKGKDGKGKGKSAPITPHIVVGTPGKIAGMIRDRALNLRNLKVFVVDEADELVDPAKDSSSEIFKIREQLPPDVQVLLFSATWDAPNVWDFAEKLAPNAFQIEVKKEQLSLKTITQLVKRCDGDDEKIRFVDEIFRSISVGQAIVFVSRVATGEDLQIRMQAAGYKVAMLCGRLDGTERDRRMGRFRSGEDKLLIATDVLSRGIDIPAVTLVVNMQLPMRFEKAPAGSVVGGDKGKGKGKGKSGKGKGKSGRVTDDPEVATYMHRIGRTGRFGALGVAISLVNQKEMSILETIKEHYRCTITEVDAIEDVSMELDKCTRD